MKAWIIADNRLGEQKTKLKAEHGLSIYLEIKGNYYLFDTGNSDLFIKNASVLGLNIDHTKCLILSHAHRDHTGGLEAYIAHNPSAPIYLSGHCKKAHCYSTRHKEIKNISTNLSLFDLFLSRFHFILHNIQLTPEISIIADIPIVHPIPSGNQTLKISDGKDNLSADNFKHEMAIAVKTNNGVIVLSACSHKGILNTMEAAHNFTGEIPIAYIGGSHFIDGYETVENIRNFSNLFHQKYPSCHLYTGHCTGDNTALQLSNLLGEKFTLFHTGDCLTL